MAALEILRAVIANGGDAGSRFETPLLGPVAKA
jgi:hypothetical protein